MVSLDPAIASYLAHQARRAALSDPSGEAGRDPTGFVRGVLAITGDALPVLAGYRVGPSHPSAFAGASHPCVAVADDGLALRPSARGVDAMHAAKRVKYAPSVESALLRLIERDRVARAGFTFRVHAAIGAEVAKLFDGAVVAEWPGYYRSELAVVDEVLRRTDVDCASLEAAQRLLDAAASRGWPLVLREDAPAERRDEPAASATFSVTLNPRDGFQRPRPRGGWDGEALLRFEVREGAIVQTRVAFGAAVDVRVATAGAIGFGASADRELGSARVLGYLVRHRASRRRELADSDALSRVLAARALGAFGGAATVEASVAGLVGAGPWGGVTGLFVAPAMILGAHTAKRFDGPPPEALRPEPPAQTLGDSGEEGLVVGWLNPYNTLYVDTRGRLVSVDETGDEHPRAASAVALLEKLALGEELGRRCEGAVVVDADVAEALATGLGLPRVAEASDDVSELFVSNEGDPTKPLLAVERCRFPRQDRAPWRTLLWAETPERLIAAARLARELAPDAALGGADSYQTTSERLAALRQAGFDRVGALPSTD